MTGVFLDVAYKDGNQNLERVETFPAVRTGRMIYALSPSGWISIKTKHVSKDKFSGEIIRNGFTIPTRITTVIPGQDHNIKKVSDVDPKVEQMLMAVFA